MYNMHSWVNDSSPYINASNLNEMELGIASGATYMATCGSAASAVAKTISISGFETARLTDNVDVQFVLYVLFTQGSTATSMTIAVNSGSALPVRDKNKTTLTSQISAGDVIAFVHSGGVYYMIGSVADTIGAAFGGTGLTTVALNSLLLGNGTGAMKTLAPNNGALFATAAGAQPTFGILPVAQGGTGGATAAAARTSLGLSNGATTRISFGTGEPTGGSDGDIYFQYSE